MSWINTNLNPAQSLTSIWYRGISPFSAWVTPTPPEVRTYATWNPSDKSAGVILSSGDLTVSKSSGASCDWVRATIGKSSWKWYWEIVIGNIDNDAYIGIANSSFVLTSNVALGNTYVYRATGAFWFGLWTWPAFWSSFWTGDVIWFALDNTALTFSFYKNGIIQWTSNLAVGTWFPLNTVYWPLTVGTTNFGATPFAYSVPSGYNAGLYDTVDLTAGLVAHYPLATNSLDISGNGYDGVDTNITYAWGKAVFNNSRITYPLALDWNWTLSLNMLVSITANGALISNFHWIWSMLCRIEQSTWVVHWDYCVSDGVWYLLETPAGSFTSGTEFMVTFIREANWNRKILVNGVEKVTWGTGTLTQHWADYSVGSHLNWGEPIIGTVRKHRLYNRVLNAAEVAALYAEG